MLYSRVAAMPCMFFILFLSKQTNIEDFVAHFRLNFTRNSLEIIPFCSGRNVIIFLDIFVLIFFIGCLKDFSFSFLELKLKKYLPVLVSSFLWMSRHPSRKSIRQSAFHIQSCKEPSKALFISLNVRVFFQKDIQMFKQFNT